jgi:prephenate dehydrogenase
VRHIRHALVIGTGLIGTSIALALRKRGVEVRLADSDDRALDEAVRLDAGRPLTATDRPADLVVLAMPPAAVALSLRDAQRARLGHLYTDVAGVKAPVVAAARKYGCDLSAFVPAHPMAGGEHAGPGAARADLFLGRTWAICPTAEVSRQSIGTVRAMAELSGAAPYELSPEVHDRAAALISHLPHVVSSALAARLENADAPALRLAGRGVRDVTRVAAGDVSLWLDILGQNADLVAAPLESVIEDLQGAARELRSGNHAALASLLQRGNNGRRRLLAESGEPDTAVSVTDQAG